MSHHTPKNPDHYHPIRGESREQMEARLNPITPGETAFVHRTKEGLQAGWEVVNVENGRVTLEGAVDTEDGVQVGTKQYTEQKFREIQERGAEFAAENPILVDGQRALSDALSKPDSYEGRAEHFLVIDSFVTSILERADAGEITNSSGAPYSKQDILFASEMYMNRADTPEDQRDIADLSRLFPRAGGLRSAVRLFMESSASREFTDSLKLHIEQASPEKAPNFKDVAIEDKVGSVALDNIGLDEPAPREDLAPKETEAEMYERFARETKQELDTLYAELRKAQARGDSWESDSLENQIRNAKQDLGEYSRKAAKARGNTT